MDFFGFGNLCLIIGLSLYAYGSTKYRLPGAPIAFNGPRGWPWQHQEWFEPRGQKLRIVGLVFEGVALLMFTLGVLPIS